MEYFVWHMENIKQVKLNYSWREKGNETQKGCFSASSTKCGVISVWIAKVHFNIKLMNCNDHVLTCPWSPRYSICHILLIMISSSLFFKNFILLQKKGLRNTVCIFAGWLMVFIYFNRLFLAPGGKYHFREVVCFSGNLCYHTYMFLNRCSKFRLEENMWLMPDGIGDS